MNVEMVSANQNRMKINATASDYGTLSSIILFPAMLKLPKEQFKVQLKLKLVYFLMQSAALVSSATLHTLMSSVWHRLVVSTVMFLHQSVKLILKISRKGLRKN